MFFTDICQVAMLNEENIASLIKQTHLPMNKSQTIFQSQELTILSSSWFPLIWGYINKYGILQDFEELPLIPIGTEQAFKEVAVLHKGSFIIHYERDEEDGVISLLRHLRCTIIKALPSYVHQNRSVFECKYIYDYKDEDLLQLLSNLSLKLGQDEMIRKFSEFSGREVKLELFRKVSSFAVKDSMQTLIKSLPFIENTSDERLVSVAQCHLIAPKELPDVMPQQMLLRIQHEAQVSFIEKLGGRQLSRREFIEEILLPEINKSIVPYGNSQSMINYILDSIAATSDKQQWQAVINALSFVQFVQSDDGKFYKPIELFHRCERLEKLFVGEKGRFPNIGQNLEVLKLKNESDVSADDIRRSLVPIYGMQNIHIAQDKARCILEHLERYSNLLNYDNLINELTNTAWIPINEKRPDAYPDSLTWYGENTLCNFGKPAEMITKKKLNLVGSVRAVIPSDIEDFKAIKLIMKSSQVICQDVIDQLLHIITYDCNEKHKTMLVLDEIYRYLQDMCNEFTPKQLECLKCKRWVWCGNCFVKPQQIVLEEYHLDMQPYIYNLPQELPKMNSLLSICGSVAEIGKESLIHVLKSIKEKQKRHTSTKEEIDRDRRICVEVLRDLGHMKLSDDDLNRILVPIRCEDAELLLEISTQAVYSPIGGLNCEEEEEEGEEDPIFLHECITEEIVKGLRIRSLTSQRIGAEDLGIEEFGQHEPLTRRINRILADYGDGLAIMKELIQNADDAGAVEVKFLYDERLSEDKQKSLIDPGMKGIQGPALWAYNDAKFSKEDFDNIVKLSGATKEDKRDKIGKFGLGFNAVYNITDVPSFISDNQLVILDPHTTHLGHAIKNKSKPGVKIPLGPKRNRLRAFQDQIRIYDGIFGMDASLLEGYKMFEGTLFRFPLRTERQAQMSEIKKLYYSKDEMKKLIRKFSNEANRLLMFTQNVRTVEFFHLEEGTKSAESMRRILHVSKKMFIPSIVHGYLTANGCQSFDIMKQASHAVEHTANGKQGILVARSLRHVVEITTNADEGLKELFEAESKYENEAWVIHSSIDDKECMSMSLKNPQLNPVASVAVCIEKNEDSKTYKLLQQQSSNAGHFYCFLPLPIPNGLNVHINSTFALSKDRKSFLEKSEDDKMHDKLETIWNKNLMSGPVSSAYIGLLKDLTTFIDLEDEAAWYSLWPQNDAVGSKLCSYKQDLIRNFYHSIINERTSVFPNSRSTNGWLNWTQIMTIEDSVKYMKNGSVIEWMMEEIMNFLQTERVIVHLPHELLEAIEESGLTKELSEITVSFPRFFSDFFIPHVEELRMAFNNYESILLFAINNFTHDPVVSYSITACECIPTQPSGRLRKPSDLVKSKSKAADLFEVNEEVFPSIKFEDCCGKLVELGMLSDVISWELLMHRAKTVNVLGSSKSQTANARVRKLLQLMEDKMLENRDDIPELPWTSIDFLPVKQKPSNWHFLEWEGTRSGKSFATSNEVYPNDLEKVVGCHKLIIDDDITGKMSSNMKRLLGIRMQCTIPDIIRQVDIISECIKGRKKSEMPAVLQSVFTHIYRCLSDAISKNPELQPQIVECFKGKAIIITNENELVNSEQVAINPQRIAEPYLYKLQSELAIHQGQIMEVLGVKETFCMEDYNSALKALEKDAGGNPLSDSQINTVRDLLESIDKERATKLDDIFLPDEGKVLRNMESVVVKECAWMKNASRKRYLHDHIPPKLALSLGAKKERSHSIASHSRGLPFGQHEKLTVRLQRILEAYPSQMQILYELLQNADDAGASEVKFILDKRHHPDEKVFGDSWKSLQGPALLVFNDAPFTHRDIEGIQNLGEGSKSDDCQKTGQYGVGFNVVYHITDAPCLLTRVKDDSVLCVFDPHARFLEECSLEEPGRMFENGRTYLKNTFPDIYKTFLPKFLTNKKSAILRLPLRSSSHALNSSIKQRATTTEDIFKMFESFKDKGPEAIVFLRNVKSVEIFTIEDTRKKPQRVFSVHADMTDENITALSLFNEEYNSLSSSIGERSMPSKKYLPFQCELTLRTSKEKRKYYDTTWRIIQKCGSINSEDLPRSLDDQYKKGKLPLIPVGGIAHKIDGSLVDGKMYCLLPLGVSSSLPLHMNGKFILNYESRRELWYTHEDSFQKTWNYYVIEHCIVPCYVQLFRTIAQPRNFAFGNADPYELFEDVFKINGVHPEQLQTYFRNFPKLGGNERAHEYYADLSKMFYTSIANEEVNVMPVLRPISNTLTIEFCPPNSNAKQFYYIDFSDRKKVTVNNFSKICIALTRIGMNIYNIPADIIKNFSESGVQLQKLTPQVVNEYLRNNAEKITQGQDELKLKYSDFGDVATAKALLEYCLKDDRFPLSGLPLLVTEDELLTMFDDNKHVYYDELSILFPLRKCNTLHPELKLTLSNYKDEISGAVRKFMLADFSRLLDEELNTDFKTNDGMVIADVKQLNAMLPVEHWLRYAWTFLQKRFEEWAKVRTSKKMGLTAREFLEPISGWCLFPVERHMTGRLHSKEYCLIRISKASHAVDGGVEMKDIINELGLPVPSSLFVDNHEVNMHVLHCDSSLSSNSKMLRDMATNTEDVNEFIDALTAEYQRKNHRFPGLSTNIAHKLLSFLSRRERCIHYREQESLRNLPLWEDVSGKLRIISSAADCYLISHNMPKDGTSFLQDKYSVILLKQQTYFTKIYNFAVVGAQIDTRVYCNLILEYFDELQPEERFAHLSYLKGKYERNELQPVLLEKLKNTRIIEKNGVVSYAKEFYHPHVKLFNVMLMKSDFPPKIFRKFSWLKFLELLGLVSVVSRAKFCSFAEEISQIQDKEERRRKSKALIQHFRATDNLKMDSIFLHQLSSIPFLVADEVDKDLCKIYPGSNNNGLLCFHDTVLHSKRNIILSWTVEHILPFYACNDVLYPVLPLNKLRVVQDISFHSVTNNLENISKSDLLYSKAEGVKAYYKCEKFEDIFGTVYKFLHKHQLNDDHAFSVLCRIPMILVKDNMISIASKVTLEREFDMPPHLFSMPTYLGKYADLFKQIGMSEKPTIHQLKEVFHGLFASSNGNALGPNEAVMCQKAICRIVKEIITNEFPSDIKLLPLPGYLGEIKSTICLYKSQDLIYFDANLDKRLTELHKPKLCLEFLNEQILANGEKLNQADILKFISKLPLALKPKRLSDIIKETIMESNTIPNVGFTLSLCNKMKCREFAGCMIRLLEHQGKGQQYDGVIDTKDILQKFLRIKVTTKQKVETVLALYPDFIPIEKSECEKDVFVTAQDERLEIYVSSSLTDEADTLTAVAAALVSFFRSYFKNPELSVHLPSLLRKDPSEMHVYLDTLGIPNSFDDIGPVDGFYPLGGYVPKDLHFLLTNDISIFNVGYYIAHKVEDPGLHDNNGDPVYIYGKISERVSKYRLNDFYKIDIGLQEQKVVHKSELYGFYRPEHFQEDI